MPFEPIKDKIRTLSDFKLERLKISCSCGRSGSYNVARQIAEHGDIPLSKFIATKVSSCSRWSQGKCGGGCDELTWMFNAAPGSEEYARESGYRRK